MNGGTYMLINEKIRASEVELTGIDGEELGVVARDEALALAKKLKADLVCTSMMSIIVRQVKTSVDSKQAFLLVIDCTTLN
jgi:translation initiation factor IF-3